MHLDLMRNLYRGPSIDASYQVSVHLAKWFQRRRFLEIDQPETRIACDGLPRMLPAKFKFIWPSGFRGEDFFRNQPIRNKNCLWWPCFINGSKLNEHSQQRAFHTSFLPSFNSFGQAVSEQMIFLEINQSETRIACGGHVC